MPHGNPQNPITCNAVARTAGRRGQAPAPRAGQAAAEGGAGGAGLHGGGGAGRRAAAVLAQQRAERVADRRRHVVGRVPQEVRHLTQNLLRLALCARAQAVKDPWAQFRAVSNTERKIIRSVCETQSRTPFGQILPQSLLHTLIRTWKRFDQPSSPQKPFGGLSTAVLRDRQGWLTPGMCVPHITTKVHG